MNAHRACDDFHGSMRPLTRRQMLGLGAAGGLALYTAQAMPIQRVLEAAAADAAAAPNAPVLVSVFLPGGVDLLDTLVPLHDYGRYADLRPSLKVQGVPLAGTSIGLHPSLANGVGGGVKGLFERGKVGFLPGIDYANPDLSHFHSRHFWETGLITDRSAPGWLGRWLDGAGSRDNPLQGVSMGYGLSPVMRSGRAPVAAVASPGDAGFWIRGVWGDAYDEAMAAYARLGKAGGGGGHALSASREAARLAKLVADRLTPYAEHDDVDPLASSIAYPEDSDFGQRLRYLAAMISKPLGIRVADVEAGADFDTHDNQAELTTLLGEVSECLSAFQADLEVRGIADRVLTFVWSEFGRRPEENDSGTDHGAGGLAWVQGDRALPGVHSDYPDLNRLDRDDNLQVTIDFRRVYSSLLEQHLGTDAGAVIPRAGAFGRVALVK
ncbi:MAG: hypothetical protein QOD13_634 [Thermoleophilaceae bacterium]|jgi:uncharacterized protein (DUF1501 family)|nr:hypothetical protein [Thermoleophilaceae bacterium]